MLILLLIGAVILTPMLIENRGSLNFDWLLGTGARDTVPVNKQLDLYLHNKYSGSALGSKTLKVWDPSITAFKESSLSTGSDGTVNTANSYPSGTQLYVYYESSNDKQWFSFVVPEMNEKDAEASTYNTVPLESFAIGTYSTDSLALTNGTTWADASTYNTSASTTTPTWKYTLSNTGADNTGIISSYDPSYGMRFDVVVYMTFSGTGYESVLIYGDFDYDFTLGSTHYVAMVIDPYELTKHKVGWKYESDGATDVSYWMDLSGIASGDSVTWQTYVYAYSDPAWCMNHGGDYGYEKVELAEHTVTIAP